MEFQWPTMLWLLVLIPVLILAYFIGQRRRQRFMSQFATLSLVKDALRMSPGIRRHLPPFFFLLALIVLTVAMARPVAVVKIPSEEGTVILAIDTSGSMSADDLKPSRIEAAKAAARTFVQRQPPTVKVGIVSFSEVAFVVQSPTNDQDAVLAAINRLYPQRGTAIGSGLLASLNTIFEVPANDTVPTGRFSSQATPTPTPTPTPVPKGVYEAAIVVLLTDGENNAGPDPRAVAQMAADRGVRVYTVGVGTSTGSVLHLQGESIRSRLDEGLLKDMAATTNGAYYNATDEGALEQIYENIGLHVVLKTEKTEVTGLLTGIAATLSLLGGAFSLLWFNRLP